MSEPIRPAATVVLIRRDGDQGPRVLMGQRGAKAVFMPSKYVFPGGSVDPSDNHSMPLPLSRDCESRLGQGPASPAAYVGAVLRELAEETGQRFGTNQPHLRFFFRAITPAGRPRRFDASFFLLEAQGLVTDPDDFSQAEDELSHLHWIGLAEARALDLPFVTEIALAEAAHLVAGGSQPGVPFFDNSGPETQFRRIL